MQDCLGREAEQTLLNGPGPPLANKSKTPRFQWFYSRIPLLRTGQMLSPFWAYALILNSSLLPTRMSNSTQFNPHLQDSAQIPRQRSPGFWVSTSAVRYQAIPRVMETCGEAANSPDPRFPHLDNGAYRTYVIHGNVVKYAERLLERRMVLDRQQFISQGASD